MLLVFLFAAGAQIAGGFLQQAVQARLWRQHGGQRVIRGQLGVGRLQRGQAALDHAVFIGAGKFQAPPQPVAQHLLRVVAAIVIDQILVVSRQRRIALQLRIKQRPNLGNRQRVVFYQLVGLG